jgi:hypothetical protein
MLSAGNSSLQDMFDISRSPIQSFDYVFHL